MSENRPPEIVPAGDAALMVVFGEEISVELNARVRGLAAILDEDPIPGVRELVPAYATLLIHYDPLATSFERLESTVLERLAVAAALQIQEGRLREIPTVFGGCYGPDLPDVARHLNMEPEEVIQAFTGATYLVYMLGFAPGEPYMGGLPPRLAMPRLENPRERVPAGTVALAQQATIYPVTSPGGWRWLGRTPIRVFDPTADPPTYLQAGDRVRFVPIPEDEYLRLGGKKCLRVP